MNKKNFVSLIALGIIVSGCAAGNVLVPAGAYNKAGQTVTLDREWTDATAVFNHRQSKSKLLSIDGIWLNSLYISEGLTSKDPLFVGAAGDNKNHIAPRPKDNMSLSEHMDYVSHALAEIGYLNVNYVTPKPVTISGQRGVRFDITAKTKKGLNIQGLGQAVTKDGKNYYIVYLAPKEHYYNANLKNAVAIMDSATLP